MSVTMPGTVNNLLVLEKYRQLIEELYIEPKNEDIIGSFLHTVFGEDEPAPPPAKRKPKSKKAAASNQPDIRTFFGNAATTRSTARQSTRPTKRVTKENNTEIETICLD